MAATETSPALLKNSRLDGSNSIRVIVPPLEPTSTEIIALLTDAQSKMMALDQAQIQTDHVLHAGMYSRTITMPPNCRLIGALIKIPTLVITVGDGLVSVGEKMQPVRGYQVIQGCAGRKQAFYSIGPLIISMIFPTCAKTVEEAEKQFTDEWKLLLSSRQPEMNSIRGDKACTA